MINELRDLIRKLKKENEERQTAINSHNILDDSYQNHSTYSHTINLYTHNNTLEIIKQIENIIGVVY